MQASASLFIQGSRILAKHGKTRYSARVRRTVIHSKPPLKPTLRTGRRDSFQQRTRGGRYPEGFGRAAPTGPIARIPENAIREAGDRRPSASRPDGKRRDAPSPLRYPARRQYLARGCGHRPGVCYSAGLVLAQRPHTPRRPGCFQGFEPSGSGPTIPQPRRARARVAHRTSARPSPGSPGRGRSRRWRHRRG